MKITEFCTNYLKDPIEIIHYFIHMELTIRGEKI